MQSAKAARGGLVRSIGRWSLAALMVNSVIGSGIFGLPSLITRQLGAAGPVAWVAAAVFSGIIMLCFAEVASRFAETGGPYLYARVAFGRFTGILMGWLTWLVRLASAAANANLFIIYMAEFWIHAQAPLARIVVLTALIGMLTAINYCGVNAGTQLSNVFTVAKLLPLLVFILLGVAYLLTHHQPVQIGFANTAHGSWLDAMILMVFAYGGFEGALLPMGEAKDPRRDAPFALIAALVICAVVYTLVQVVVMGVLANSAASDRPLAVAAHVFMGEVGTTFITVGALLSVYGYLASMTLNVPRLTFALAEQGDFPRVFAAVHRRFRTPYVSILVFGALLWVLAVTRSFEWNVVLSAIARLFYYGIVCAALIVLRRRAPGEARFRLPGGSAVAIAGIALCVVFLTAMQRGAFYILAVVAVIAFLNWLWASRRAESSLQAPSSSNS
ncbi:MAG TPA: APC family permease [Terriglobales bacterium]|nr:APC family permease [Terriglobales bacterium]